MQFPRLAVGNSYVRDDFTISIEKVYYFTTEPTVHYAKVCVQREGRLPMMGGFITLGWPTTQGLNRYISKFLPGALAKFDGESDDGI